jgi:signal transduction histidine kinase
MGVVYLENNVAAGAFTAMGLTVVRLLAAQAAISLDNAKLYSHLEETVNERTSKLREAHAKLLKLARAATEVQMAGGFAHEMRNALSPAANAMSTLMTSDGELIVDAFDDIDALKRLLRVVRKGVRRGLTMTSLVHDYAQTDHTGIGDDDVPLQALALELRRERAATLEKHQITLELKVPDEVRLGVRALHARAILAALIDNACDSLALVADRPRQLQIEAEVHDGRVALRVVDNGAGINADALPRVGEPFFSTKGAGGTGLALALSKKLAELYGGALQFRSRVNEGATFEVELPRGGSKVEAG